jgi:hypothetical protein
MSALKRGRPYEQEVDVRHYDVEPYQSAEDSGFRPASEAMAPR